MSFAINNTEFKHESCDFKLKNSEMMQLFKIYRNQLLRKIKFNRLNFLHQIKCLLIQLNSLPPSTPSQKLGNLAFTIIFFSENG